MITGIIRFARVAFFAGTLVATLLYVFVLDPMFTTPNTFEDGLGYLESGQRLLATGSPYQDWQLAGPYGSVTTSSTYRYPPPFAQVAALFVLAGADRIFLVILVGTCLLAPLVLARSRRQIALALWLGLAFMPDWIAAWEGQVTGLLTICIALALYESPTAIWAGAVLKVTPILAMPAALRRMPRAVGVSTAVLLPLLIGSVILSPVAWAQFPVVLVNGFLGGSDHQSLAPSGMARYAALGVVGALLVASVVLARHRWPMALYLAVVAGLLGPGFFPKYALPVLVPFLFIAMDSKRARRWSFVAFLGLAFPFTSFSVVVLVGMGLLGVAVWRLGSETGGQQYFPTSDPI
jgi:hypothetical protein